MATLLLFHLFSPAIIVVIIALLTTGSCFGFMTLPGIIYLAGIVVNNAIVLPDIADHYRLLKHEYQ